MLTPQSARTPPPQGTVTNSSTPSKSNSVAVPLFQPTPPPQVTVGRNRTALQVQHASPSVASLPSPSYGVDFAIPERPDSDANNPLASMRLRSVNSGATSVPNNATSSALPMAGGLNAARHQIAHEMLNRAEVFAQDKRRKELESAITSMEQWASANDKENQLLRETIQLAKELFVATISPQYTNAEAEVTSPSKTGDDDADNLGPKPSAFAKKRFSKGELLSAAAAMDPTQVALSPRSAEQNKLMGTTKILKNSENDRETRNAVMRAAVSSLLLERICATFSRYHSVLGTVSEMILRSVFVPDTEEMRSLLGGSVTYELPNIPPQYKDMLAPYCRKTFFVAHDEVASNVMALAKANRAIEMRLSRQGKIFDSTVKHWVSSIVRNYFLSWRHYTRKQQQQKQKFHTKFARLRIEELKTRAVANWRTRAATVRRAAAADAGHIEVQQLTQSTEQLHEMILHLTDVNNNLGERLMRHEKERQELQGLIAAKEKQFIELQSRAVEMDRVGTELLDGMLQSEPPPRGNNAIEVLVLWAHRMIEDAGGSFDDTKDPLNPLLSEDYAVAVPLSALAAVMIRFNSVNAPSRDEVAALHNSPKRAVTMLIEIYERLTEQPCLVNYDQLASMQRGVLLLFLAGLMRHMSNWVVNKPPSVPAHRKQLLRVAAQTTMASNRDAFDSNAAEDFERKASLVPASELVSSHLYWLDRIKIQQEWIAASMAALHLALEASTQRPVSLTSEEQEDMVTFLDISMVHLLDILPRNNPDVVFVQLLKCVQQLFPEMRKVYLAYAVPVMHYLDFTRLAKECRLLGPLKLSKREIELMCRDAYLRHAASRPGDGGDPDDDNQSSDEEFVPSPASPVSPSFARRTSTSISDLSQGSPRAAPVIPESTSIDVSIKIMEPRIFTECVIRSALMYHRRLSRDKNLELTVAMLSAFILETLVPHALRLDVDRFRQTARHPLVRQVLSRHKVALRKAFRRFATVNDGEAIPKLQFHIMSKECRWLSKTITTEVINEVFRRCQGGPELDGGVEGLDLSEWHEALCALAVYSDPNPLVPLHQKLSPFIEEKVLSALQL